MRFWVLGAVISLQVFASVESSQFSIEEGLVDRIYTESVQKSESDTRNVGLALTPSLQMFQPSDWRLANAYFETQYADHIALLPSLEISTEFPVARYGRFSFSADFGLGYGYQTGVFSFRSAEGSKRSDNVQVHRVPALLEATLRYDGLTSILPFISMGAGVQWIYQVGTIDGFSQGFWVPTYLGRLGALLFSQSSSWFGGVTLSVSYLGSFATAQTVKGLSYGAGVRVFL